MRRVAKLKKLVVVVAAEEEIQRWVKTSFFLPSFTANHSCFTRRCKAVVACTSTSCSGLQNQGLHWVSNNSCFSSANVLAVCYVAIWLEEVMLKQLIT